MRTYKAYEPPKKQCSKCHEWKPLEMFYNQAASPDGKARACKTCSFPGYTPWDNSPRICPNCQSEFVPTQSNQVYCCPQCSEAYYEKELRRVGRFRILERDSFRCIYCGMSSVENATELHVDHIIPRAAGGQDIASNLVTSCKRCNLEKHCRIMSEDNITRILTEVQKRNLAQGIEPPLIIKLQS